MTIYAQKTFSVYGYGNYTFVPTTAPDCGILRLANKSIKPTDEEALIQTSSANILSAARGVHHFEIWTKTLIQHPPQLAQIPRIYEKSLEQSAWTEARIDMIQTVFANSLIHSISFKPKNPTLQQTWYFRNGPFSDSNIQQFLPDCKYTSSRGSHFKSGKLEMTQRENPQESGSLSGFLRPYPQYDSENCRPDLSLDSLIPTYLSSMNDFEIDGAFPTRLQFSIQLIVQSFLKDTECQATALTILNPIEGRVEKMIFSKM